MSFRQLGTLALVWLVAGCASVERGGRSPAAASRFEQAESKRIPWSGYWWSMAKGELALGWDDGAGRKLWRPDEVLEWDRCLGSRELSCRKRMDAILAGQAHGLSPLMKFDLWAYKKFGIAAHAARRELEIHYIGDNRAHRYWDSRGYAGKCIGWALAAREFDEPVAAQVIDGILFKPADIKGILATIYNGAQFFVPNEEVFGTEFHDRSDHSRAAYEDVSPQDFVRALRMSIGKGEMLEGDLDPGDGVWNYPIHRYELDWKLASPTLARVSATIHYADDEVGIDEVFSNAKPRKDLLSRRLDFELTLPASSMSDIGQATGGRWIGTSVERHPDVLILGLEDGWRKTIYDYADTEMKTEVNFSLIRRVRIRSKWIPAVDELLRSYYSR